MTGYTVNTGSSEEFASGWDRIFGDDKKKAKTEKQKPAKGKAKSPAKRGKKK